MVLHMRRSGKRPAAVSCLGELRGVQLDETSSPLQPFW